MSEQTHVKKIGGGTFTTLQGSGFNNLFNDNGKAIREEMRQELFLGGFLSRKVPMAVAIEAEGKQAIAIGYKNGGDYNDLAVSRIIMPDGKTVKLDNTITIEFDKKNNQKSGHVRGAISNDSAVRLLNTVHSIGNDKHGKIELKYSYETPAEKITQAVKDIAIEAVSNPKNFSSEHQPSVVAKSDNNRSTQIT